MNPRFVLVAACVWGALAACSSGSGDDGGSGGGGGGVVVVGAVAADGVGQSRGIGSYDIEDGEAGAIVTLFDRGGSRVGAVRVEARPSEGLVWEFSPAEAGVYTAGSAWLVDEGAVDASRTTTRIALRVPDDRGPMREIRIDLAVAVDPTGATGGPELVLVAPVDLNTDYPPALGGSFADSGGRAQATLRAVESGAATQDGSAVRGWLEALGFGPTRSSAPTSLLLGVLFDAQLSDALFEHATAPATAEPAGGGGAAGLGTSGAALDADVVCDISEIRIDCRWECATEGDLPEDWLSFVQPDCLACMTLYLPRLKRLRDCLAARAAAVDDAWCKTHFDGCRWGLFAVASPDRQSCRCACHPLACDSYCAAVVNLFHFTKTGDARCADDGRSCDCSLDPTGYCEGKWGGSYCGEGAFLDPIAGFACDTAACGDGWRNDACERNPGRVEACDASSSEGDTACGVGFECRACECVPCAQSVECGDGRISTNCPDLVEECDPAADPPGCAPGFECALCGCVPVVAPPVGGPDAGSSPDAGGGGGGGTIPAACTAMLTCARTAAPDQYDDLDATFGPGGSCHVAIGLPAGTCERACQEALDAWLEDEDC